MVQCILDCSHGRCWSHLLIDRCTPEMIKFGNRSIRQSSSYGTKLFLCLLLRGRSLGVILHWRPGRAAPNANCSSSPITVDSKSCLDMVMYTDVASHIVCHCLACHQDGYVTSPPSSKSGTINRNKTIIDNTRVIQYPHIGLQIRGDTLYCPDTPGLLGRFTVYAPGVACQCHLTSPPPPPPLPKGLFTGRGCP